VAQLGGHLLGLRLCESQENALYNGRQWVGSKIFPLKTIFIGANTIFFSWKISRNNWLFRHYRDYFPVQLIKTADLPPNKNYILASFPHGVLA